MTTQQTVWKHELATLAMQAGAEGLAQRIILGDASKLTKSEVDLASYALCNREIDNAEMEIGDWLAGDYDE